MIDITSQNKNSVVIYMKHRIKKVAVLGSGVMGSGIACQLANIGLDVLLLDIVPFNLEEKDKKNPIKRNSIVNGALKAAIKSKPAPLYDKAFAKRIRTGNFDDDFDKIADADWIIEVVIEQLDTKKKIFEKVENTCKPTALVSSNTSSIPIHLLCEDRSDNFKKNFCGTHFFNPPRYMSLLEIIPHTDSSPEIIDFFMDYGDRYLGKTTVLCKDTPAFIANRIGVMSGAKTYALTDKYEMSIEEVDALTGPLIGRPKTATYKLQDLVGIDTGVKVSNFVLNNVKNDEFVDTHKDYKFKFIDFLVENKFLGNKTKKGFYQRTKEKDEKGKTVYLALDIKTLEYKKATKPRSALVGDVRNIENMSKRFQVICSNEDKEGQFLQEYFAALLAYSANRIPEITEQYYSIDDAMKTGYRWQHGPFELWDLIGFDKGIELIEKHGEKLAPWVSEMKAAGETSFYHIKDGKKKYFDLESKTHLTVPGTESFIILDAIRGNEPIIKNSEATVHDIGDGVMCVEFRSKSNAIGDGIGTAIRDAIKKAEEEGWNGVVIGNNAENFTVGANLMMVGMMAMQKQFTELDKMVNDFQQLTMLCRTSKVPVVVATQGYVFGGGCEIAMHCNAGIYAAESYIGLVEVGVGLLPGGGGTKEMAVRVSDSYFVGDVEIPTLIDHFKPVATASVATSAYEAYGYNLLQDTKDFVAVKTANNIGLAKEKVLQMAPTYVAPTIRNDIRVLGRTGMAALYTAINEFKLGEFMSDYDVEIARKVAYVMCGGDLTSAQEVGEQYLLDIEREAFLSLLGNQKTLDRIQHTLTTNKPLRN